jgi:hypothetical protein
MVHSNVSLFARQDGSQALMLLEHQSVSPNVRNLPHSTMLLKMNAEASAPLVLNKESAMKFPTVTRIVMITTSGEKEVICVLIPAQMVGWVTLMMIKSRDVS